MFYLALALWIARGGGPVSIQPTDPTAIPTAPIVEPAPRDPERERRTLRVLLEMARLDAIEARNLRDKTRARRDADDLLDEWLTHYGRPAG